MSPRLARLVHRENGSVAREYVIEDLTRYRLEMVPDPLGEDA
jgi:hypothetical protein